MTLRHIAFLGPSREPALLDFAVGLNVVYGASETGKSFVVEAIDFMLGGKKPLRDIPERNGYNMILLAFETETHRAFTLQRSVDGGNFLLYEGLHFAIPLGIEGEVLSEKHSNENDKNLSARLLEHIGLENKLIKKSATSTRNLSFRDIVRLCVVEETEIQKKSSPIESGQYTLRTAEYSVFKLLLTGVDDSAFISDSKIQREAKGSGNSVELLNELINSYRKKLDERMPQKEMLSEEIDHVSIEIENLKSVLYDSEEQLRTKIEGRNALRHNVELGEARCAEITELRARFALLMNHYNSDLERLDSLKESGSLMEALSLSVCPLCGAAPENSRLHLECEGNLTLVAEASNNEAQKILTLKTELQATLSQLEIELNKYHELLPKLRNDLSRNIEEVEHITSAVLKDRGL